MLIIGSGNASQETLRRLFSSGTRFLLFKKDITNEIAVRFLSLSPFFVAAFHESKQLSFFTQCL